MASHGAMKNPYKDGISFAQLAKDDPDFGNILKPNMQLDFNDPPSVLQLTKSLLRRDFGIAIELPPDRLCPPVPNRVNYLLWIESLLRSSAPLSPNSSSAQDGSSTPAARKIIGLDIGTGASCIYALLGCASNPSWSFLATDIDTKSLQYARRNIEVNRLSDRIHLIESKPDGPLIPLQEGQRLDFVLCNPPFYSSDDELQKSASAKAKPPNSACTGSANEMVVEGGEQAFISRIINESLELRDRVQWCTSMVGKRSSLAPLIERLKKERCTNWAVGELVQGTKTKRWVLGWSWQSWRPEVEVARGVGAGTLEKRMLCFPSEYRFVVDGQDGTSVRKKVDQNMEALRMRWEWDKDKGEGVGWAEGNVWGRSARRKKSGKDEMEEVVIGKSANWMTFGFRIMVEEKDGKTEVLIKWIKGSDSVLFESLCGMVKRIVETDRLAKRKVDNITS